MQGGGSITLYKKALMLYFWNLKKIENLQNLNFFAKTDYKVKLFAKKIPKNDKIYILKSP